MESVAIPIWITGSTRTKLNRAHANADAWIQKKRFGALSRKRQTRKRLAKKGAPLDNAKIVTVLTTDIRNFTYQSRPRDNEDNAAFENRFQVLCDLIRDFHNLTVRTARSHDKGKEGVVLSTGDGLIIGFQDEHHAVTAFHTAIDLQRQYVPFFREANKLMLERRSSTGLGFGIGIHTGYVVLRQYESYHVPGAVNTMLLGDALNIATRIESLTKEHPGCSIMLSEDTFALLQKQLGESAVRDLIDYQVHQIRGYRPLRLYGAPTPKDI